MKITSLDKIEDCFDGTLMGEVHLDHEITEGLIRYLGDFGELDYFPAFARPFFRLDIPELFMLKGIQGNRHLRIIFLQGKQAQAEIRLSELLSRFSD